MDTVTCDIDRIGSKLRIELLCQIRIIGCPVSIQIINNTARIHHAFIRYTGRNLCSDGFNGVHLLAIDCHHGVTVVPAAVCFSNTGYPSGNRTCVGGEFLCCDITGTVAAGKRSCIYSDQGADHCHSLVAVVAVSTAIHISKRIVVCDQASVAESREAASLCQSLTFDRNGNIYICAAVCDGSLILICRNSCSKTISLILHIGDLSAHMTMINPGACVYIAFRRTAHIACDSADIAGCRIGRIDKYVCKVHIFHNGVLSQCSKQTEILIRCTCGIRSADMHPADDVSFSIKGSVKLIFSETDWLPVAS